MIDEQKDPQGTGAFDKPWVKMYLRKERARSSDHWLVQASVVAKSWSAIFRDIGILVVFSLALIFGCGAEELLGLLGL